METQIFFFNRTWLSNFLSNVLGVVVGIALTFGVSALVQRRSEQKEIRTMMTLVKQEITDNRDMLKGMTKSFQQTKELCRLLLTSEWKTMPQDSVWYLLKHKGVQDFPFAHTNWDIFQNSNVIKNFDDIELISTISELYTYVEIVHKWYRVYIDEELAASQDIKQTTKDLDAHVASLLKNEKLRTFMDDVYTEEKYSFVESFAACIDLSDYVLHLIDKSGKYNTTIKDLSKDFEMFRQEKENGSDKEKR